MVQKLTDVYISFRENSIVVKSGSTNKNFSNSIAINKETSKIVGIGETEAEMSAHNPGLWEKEKHRIIFEPIYNPKDFNPEITYWSLTLLVHGFVSELRGFRLLNNFNCQATIPGYEFFSKEAKDYFEYSVQANMRFKKFIINGNDTGLDGWKIRFASGSLEWGRLAGYLVPIIIAINEDIWSATLGIPKNGYWVLLILLITMALAAWIIEIIWLLGIQQILPKTFIRWMFDGQIKGKSSVSKLLSQLILRDEN